ncbi:MAG: peptide chain release factor N(5)-glutamine methyltransferase [Pseudomonadota bacterium]
MSPKSAAELIRLGAKILEQAGVSDAQHDARSLMAFVLSESQATAMPLSVRLIAEDQLRAFDALIARRAKREPLQHILGKATIFELVLKSDRRALIPRQDSAEIIALAMRCRSNKHSEPFVMADLGTGSGVLLAECLNQFENATGIAVEQDADALSLAVENFADLDLTDRIDLFNGSWSDWPEWAACDLIISNPPYIRSDVIPTLQAEVREHDPLAALDGGPDGLNAYREIIELAGIQMKSGAQLIFEIGFDQNQSVSQLLLAEGFTDLRHQQDFDGNDRAIAATKT